MSFLDKYRHELQRIRELDPRYELGAYVFIQQGVSFAAKRFFTEKSKERQHISGQQLLEALREFALQQYGPLTYDVLAQWGIHQTEDIGNLVFSLVEHGLLGASEQDSPKDFAGGYDFTEAFLKPFSRKSQLCDWQPIE